MPRPSFMRWRDSMRRRPSIEIIKYHLSVSIIANTVISTVGLTFLNGIHNFTSIYDLTFSTLKRVYIMGFGKTTYSGVLGFVVTHTFNLRTQN